MIPLNFHFCFYRGEDLAPWRDIYTFCLKSCIKSIGSQQITVYYDRPGEGGAWNDAQSLDGILWKLTEFPTEYQIPRLIMDVFRLEILGEHGGFFCDLDFIFLSSFEKFRHNKAVIGIQCKAKKKLACSIIGAEPDSEFIMSYLDRLQSFPLDDLTKYERVANTIPWDLSKVHPVSVLPRPVFFPWCWSNKKFLTGGALNVKQSAAVCVWGTVYPEITMDDLKKTSIARIIEKVEMDVQPTAVTSMPGCIVQFL